MDAINDSLKGVGSTQWRYIERLKRKGLCPLCRKPITEADTRISRKSGKPKVVRRSAHKACEEAKIARHLYPQNGGANAQG